MELKESVQRQFGAVAAHYGKSFVHVGGPDLDALVASGIASAPARVLDVGCGAGHTALAFAPHVEQVTALDLTPAMLAETDALAAERGLTNVETRLGDAEALPFDAAAFDLVVSRLCAHHFLRPECALAEMTRVLAPGARLLIVDAVAAESPLVDTFLQTIELLRDPSHVRDYRVSEWQRMLGATALEVSPDVGRTAMRIDFAAWIERMRTPAAEAAAITRLMDGAPGEVRDAMALGAPGCEHDFTLEIGRFEARAR